MHIEGILADRILDDIEAGRLQRNRQQAAATRKRRAVDPAASEPANKGRAVDPATPEAPKKTDNETVPGAPHKGDGPRASRQGADPESTFDGSYVQQLLEGGGEGHLGDELIDIEGVGAVDELLPLPNIGQLPVEEPGTKSVQPYC